MTSIIEQKQALRREMRARVDALDAQDWHTLSELICARLAVLSSFASAHTVFCFVGTPREINTKPFLAHALEKGKRLCVPLCVSSGVMELRQISALSELAPGAHGILEPPRAAPLVNASQIDLAVIPCLSCNREGLRLGKGGGFYDRFLAEYAGVAVMPCPERLMTESIPVEKHDRAVPRVLTERSYYEHGVESSADALQLLQKPLGGL